LTVPEVNQINNILTQMNAKKIPYNTRAHNGAEKVKQAYMNSKNTLKDEDSDDEVERKHQQREERRRKAREAQGAGGGGVSESKKSESKQSNYFDEDSEKEEADNTVKRIGKKKAVEALKKFATKKQTDRYNEPTGAIHSNVKEAETLLDAFAKNHDRRRKSKEKMLLNDSPTMVDPNLMEEQKRKAQEGLKTMASTLKKKEMLKDLKRVADYKEKQNEEASKKRQAIMAEGKTDLPIRQPTPNTGIGKMADADSTVKPKGQVLVEEFIELKDTDPTKAEAKRKQLRDEFDEEDINVIVNKTPGKTVKEKKAIKALIRSNDPIELPALPPPHICQVNHHQEHQ
jgi:hypothetical protein